MKIFRNVLGIIALALALHPLVLPPAWSWWAQAAPATGPAGRPATSAPPPPRPPTTTSAPARPLKLAFAGKKVDIQIVQGNTVISELPAKGPIMLEPKPFALKIKGSVDEFSILPLADPKLFASVRFGNRPLCAMEGTGGAYTPGDMFLHSKELELFEGDAKGIAALCGDKDESKADPKMLEIISNQFKVTPLILTSGRMYIMKEDGRGGKEGNLTVKTIEDKTPAKGQKIWLILMLENPLGEGLKEIEWIEVPLEFVAEKP